MLRHQDEWRKQAYDSQIHEYPEEVKREYLDLCNWIRELSRRYGQGILIRVIDAFSPMGLFKAIRYRFRKYPTFIVDRRESYTGWDRQTVDDMIARH